MHHTKARTAIERYRVLIACFGRFVPESNIGKTMLTTTTISGIW
jgi:hypothetical protein